MINVPVPQASLFCPRCERNKPGAAATLRPFDPVSVRTEIETFARGIGALQGQDDSGSERPRDLSQRTTATVCSCETLAPNRASMRWNP